MYLRPLIFAIILFFLSKPAISEVELNHDISDTSLAIVLFEQAKLSAYKREYIGALDLYYKSLEIKNQYPGNYEPDIVRIYNNIGTIHLNLYKINEAWIFFDKAESSLKERFGSTHSWLGAIYTNKGITCTNNGDYERALFFFKESLVIKKRDNNLEGIIYSYYNLGLLYFNMGNYEKSLNYFLGVIKLNKEVKIYDLARVNNMLGMIYVKLGKIEEADKCYKKSISIRELKYGYSNYDTAKGYYYYGCFCIEQGKLEKGLSLLVKAYSILLKTVGFNNLYTSRGLTEIGHYYAQKEELDTAMYYYQKALQSINPKFKDSDVAKNPIPKESISKFDLALILKKKAKVLQKYGDKEFSKKKYYLQLSLETYERAIETIEQLRSSYLFEESKLFLTQNEKETYSEVVNAALQLYALTNKKEYAAKAFVYAEKSKAAVLQASLRETKAKHVGGIPDSLLEKELNIHREIAVYEKFVRDEKEYGTYDTTKVEQWESMIFNLYREKEDLIKVFESDYPAYHKMKYDHSVKSLDSIQKLLDENQVLVEYTLADSVLISQVITPKEYRFFSLSIDSNFHKQLEIYTNCLRYYDLEKDHSQQYENYTNSAQYLYEKLFAPLQIPKGVDF